MKKKIIALVLAVTMLGLAVVGGTLAYFTDTDNAENVFVVGSVDINLVEENADGTDFTQSQTLLPGVPVEKDVYVENTGKNSAYVRVFVTIPQYVVPTWNNAGWTIKAETVNADKSTTYELWYNTALAKDEKTDDCLTAVEIDKYVDKELNGALDQKVLVKAEAIQVAGFNSAEEAFAALDAQKLINDGANVVTTAQELEEALAAGNNVVLSDDVEFTTSDASNGYGATALNVSAGQTIDGAGNTIEAPASTGTWDSAISVTGGTIKNLTVASGFRGIFIKSGDKVILENVVIDGPTYTISCDQANNNGLTATNSTFNGWTSYAGTIGNVEFIDCKFGEGAGYAFCRPYAPTVFVNCEFEAGYAMDPRAAVVLENCTLGGVLITAENVGTLVSGDLANVTVK